MKYGIAKIQGEEQTGDECNDRKSTAFLHGVHSLFYEQRYAVRICHENFEKSCGTDVKILNSNGSECYITSEGIKCQENGNTRRLYVEFYNIISYNCF